MLLNDLKQRFNQATPSSQGFFQLMKSAFSYYASLNRDFFSNLGNLVETNTLNSFLQNEIRSRLFDAEYCKTIESTKKRFLAENIKLEQFIQEKNFHADFLNDLTSLKRISDRIYDLLQRHWEFFRYEKAAVNNKVLIGFLLEIDQINIAWETYLEKFLSVTNLLAAAEENRKIEGFKTVTVDYHLPESTSFTFDLIQDLNQFLNQSYVFILKVHNVEESQAPLEVLGIDTLETVRCRMRVPNQLAVSFERFLHYLSIDIVKKETLVKYVMEVIRLQQGGDMSKQAMTPIQKNVAKALNGLVPGGYVSLKKEEEKDSVTILKSLCEEMDQLKIKHKDLLLGTSGRLARNEEHQKQPNQAKVDFQPVIKKNDLFKDDPNKDGKSEGDTADKDQSTVKVNVGNKEHIGYLTN